MSPATVALTVLMAGLTYPLSFGGFTSFIPVLVPDAVPVPVAAYNISGEYSMLEAAAAHGDEDGVERGALPIQLEAKVAERTEINAFVIDVKDEFGLTDTQLSWVSAVAVLNGSMWRLPAGMLAVTPLGGVVDLSINTISRSGGIWILSCSDVTRPSGKRRSFSRG